MINFLGNRFSFVMFFEKSFVCVCVRGFLHPRYSPLTNLPQEITERYNHGFQKEIELEFDQIWQQFLTIRL